VTTHRRDSCVGLADSRLAPALREMHSQVWRSWTMAQLASAFTLGLLRPLHAHRRATADGIPPHLAHGGRKGPTPASRPGNRRGRRPRRLWLGEHLLRSVQPTRRPASGSRRSRRLVARSRSSWTLDVRNAKSAPRDGVTRRSIGAPSWSSVMPLPRWGALACTYPSRHGPRNPRLSAGRPPPSHRYGQPV
jgi:hypothetical protein